MMFHVCNSLDQHYYQNPYDLLLDYPAIDFVSFYNYKIFMQIVTPRAHEAGV